MSGLEFVGGRNVIRERLATYVELGHMGFDAGIVEVAKVAETELKGVLTEQSHDKGTKTPATRGGPPAKITGTLADSVAPAVKFRRSGAIAFIGPVGRESFYRLFLERGWHPNGGRRRTKREQKALHPTNGVVKFPFVRDAELRVRAIAGPIVSRAVFNRLTGGRS